MYKQDLWRLVEEIIYVFFRTSCVDIDPIVDSGIDIHSTNRTCSSLQGKIYKVRLLQAKPNKSQQPRHSIATLSVTYNHVQMLKTDLIQHKYYYINVVLIISISSFYNTRIEGKTALQVHTNNSFLFP